MRSYLNYYAYNNGSTQILNNYLTQCSGINLNDFFNDWLLQPGFTHLSLEHSDVEPSGSNYQLHYQIRQRIKQAYHLYNNMPVTVSYFNWDMSRQVETVMVSGECTDHITTLSYIPAYIAIDFDEKLQDDISDEWLMIKDTGGYTFDIGLMDLDVHQTGADSVLFRVEHNWIGADAMYHPIPNLHLNTFRYWTVGGVFDSTFKADATLNYDKRPTFYLDSNFISNSEDSLVMMYRPNQDSDWAQADSFFVNVESNSTNGVGLVTIYNIKQGEYALGIYDARIPTDTNTRVTCAVQTGVKEIAEKPGFKLFPNPAEDKVMLIFNSNAFIIVSLSDLRGKKIAEQKIGANQTSTEFNLTHLASGVYMISMTAKDGTRSSKKFVKN